MITAHLLISGLTEVAFYGANFKPRAAVDAAVDPAANPRQFGYSSQMLTAFRNRAAERPALNGRSASKVCWDKYDDNGAG